MIGIILASGSSKRLGRNKLLEIINNKCVIEYIVEEALKVKFSKLILIYKDKEIYELFKEKKIMLIYNDRHFLGQSESVKLGVENSMDSSEPLMFMVGDQPLLKNKTISRIIQEYSNEEDIIVPRINGTNRMPTIFGNRYKKEFLEIEGDVGGRAIIKNHKEKIKFIDLNFDLEHQFLDIDTEKNLEFIKNIMEE